MEGFDKIVLFPLEKKQCKIAKKNVKKVLNRELDIKILPEIKMCYEAEI